MDTFTNSQVREKLADVWDEVEDSREEVILRRRGHEDLALLPAQELARRRQVGSRRQKIHFVRLHGPASFRMSLRHPPRQGMRYTTRVSRQLSSQDDQTGMTSAGGEVITSGGEEVVPVVRRHDPAVPASGGEVNGVV
jgi:hypothetical protein